MIVMVDPPVVAPMLGITAVATSAAAYSNEVETERSTPLFKTSSVTTEGEAAIGEMQMMVFSLINDTEPVKTAPNLQRMALMIP
jgi:hypothetical protein